jgi:hypothetical protein
MARSRDVFKLVEVFERLPFEDQDKILRIVELLPLVPLRVQECTQRMLRELLESGVRSKRECSAGVDELIEYLEGHAAIAAEHRDAFAGVGVPWVGHS